MARDLDVDKLFRRLYTTSGESCSISPIVQEAQKQSSTVPAFDIFQQHRTRFFRDYVYVLQLTAPLDYGEAEPPLMPAGFQTCPLALKMMETGRRWEHLHRYDARTVPPEIALQF